jgi:hypothetical protein
MHRTNTLRLSVRGRADERQDTRRGDGVEHPEHRGDLPSTTMGRNAVSLLYELCCLRPPSKNQKNRINCAKNLYPSTKIHTMNFAVSMLNSPKDIIALPQSIAALSLAKLSHVPTERPFQKIMALVNELAELTCLQNFECSNNFSLCCKALHSSHGNIDSIWQQSFVPTSLTYCIQHNNIRWEESLYGLCYDDR